MKRFATCLTVAVFGLTALHSTSAWANNSHKNHPNKPAKQSSMSKEHCKSSKPPFHRGTGTPGTIVDPVHQPPIKITDPIVISGGTTVVRDHRHPISVVTGQGGVTVTPSGFGPIVRDHRGTPGLGSPLSGLAGEAGTVVKTVGRDASAIGSGLEHAAGSVVRTVGRDVGAVGSGLEHAAGSAVKTVEHAASDAVDAIGDFFGF